MSVKFMVEAFSLKLKPTQLLVLLALADHADSDGTNARPGIARIAWKTNLSDSQVEKLMRSLRERGIIEKVAGGGNGRAVEYKISFADAERKPAFDVSQKVQPNDSKNQSNQPPSVADDSPFIQPPPIEDDSNHSAVKTDIIQPQKAMQSAVTGGVPTVIEPSIKPPYEFSSSAENSMSPFSGENDDGAPVLTRAERIKIVFEKGLKAVDPNARFTKGNEVAIQQRIGNGFSDDQLVQLIHFAWNWRVTHGESLKQFLSEVLCDQKNFDFYADKLWGNNH